MHRVTVVTSPRILISLTVNWSINTISISYFQIRPIDPSSLNGSNVAVSQFMSSNAA